MARVACRVVVSNDCVCLKGAGSAVAPIVQLGLYHGSDFSEYGHTCDYEEQAQSYINSPVNMDAWHGKMPGRSSGLLMGWRLPCRELPCIKSIKFLFCMRNKFVLSAALGLHNDVILPGCRLPSYCALGRTVGVYIIVVIICSLVCSYRLLWLSASLLLLLAQQARS